MKYVTDAVLTAGIVLLANAAHSESLREKVLRDAIVDGGLLRADETHIDQPAELVAIGKLLFESRLLSFDEDTACASCHLDQFGSADGVPNAIGTEGEGVGVDRVLAGGDIVPRNTLPFWGRGGVGFESFFWDGKVDATSGTLISQFGDRSPSLDPLVVAVHLPPTEIGEMVIDRRDTVALQAEDIDTANELYDILAKRVRDDPILGPDLSAARNRDIGSLRFLDIAEALASFIRLNYRVQPTRLHEFAFADGLLTAEEVAGGLIFYGRGGCVACHNGAYFTDFEYHTVPFLQAGFGKNGFGVDYGRFNVTLDEAEKYRFRTPPLYNASRTSPYGHSGSIVDLGDAIRAHVDPLRNVQPQNMSLNDRNEFYEKLRLWSATPLNGIVMTDRDVKELTAFLGTLSYESALPVRIVD